MSFSLNLPSFKTSTFTANRIEDLFGRDAAQAARSFMNDARDLFQNDFEDLLDMRARPRLDQLKERLDSVLGGNIAAQVEAFTGDLDVGRLDELLDDLPPEFTRPDATPTVLTGSDDITREEALLGASLAAVPRIVRALGPEAQTVETQGRVFQVIERYDDPASGFDALHLRALDGGEDIFAVDGLEVGSEPDALSALDLARPQVRSAEFREFVLDARDAALAGRSLFFTGPSLGGAGAQVAAYEATEALLAAGVVPGPGAVRLVTVDALGGRDAAESINGGSLNPAVLARIEALNLTTEGDIIPRIGSHIGQTITFQPVDINGRPVELSSEEAHVNIPSLLATLRSDALFAAGERGTLEEVGGFARLSNAAAGEVNQLLLANGIADNPEGNIPLQLTGQAGFNAAGTRWELDADDNGAIDLAVNLSAPIADRSDLVFG